MTNSKRLLVLLGLLLSIAVAETTLRLSGAAIPVTSDWPSVASELKSDQMSKLPDHVEVVFLGSSITEAAVDPGYLIDLGVVDSAYNAALPFSTPASNEVWLRDVILPTIQPQVLVLGVTVWPASDDQVSPLELGIQKAAKGYDSPLLEVSALWRHRGVMASLDTLLTRKRFIDLGFTDELGHQTIYYDVGGGTLEGQFGPYGRAELSPRQETALRSIVEMAHASGAEIVLLLEPGRYPGTVPDSTVKQYIEWLRALAAELKVPFWDTYSQDWDPGLYADGSHFNRLGTSLYTEHLGRVIGSYLRAKDATMTDKPSVSGPT